MSLRSELVEIGRKIGDFQSGWNKEVKQKGANEFRGQKWPNY